MLKILSEKWAKNEDKLRTAISKIKNVNDLTYLDLVRLTFSTIYNDDSIEYTHQELNCKRITEIDDGDYQGTLIFMIPFKTYQPDEGEYLMTYVGYGSCSGCDALQSIMESRWGIAHPDEQQITDLLHLCRDIVTNTIKPYNYGWRYKSEFDQIDF